MQQTETHATVGGWSRAGTPRVILFALVMLLAWTAPSLVESQIRSDIEFDHGMSGFPLTGGHAQVKCERCHLQGLFRGTPTQCFQCHAPGGRVISTFKPANHLPTTVNCSSCHRTTNWKPAFFTHNGVAPGTCAKCHNNSTVQGKPTTHIPTSMACDSCHRTVFWAGALFRHTGVAPGTCMTCHNGVQARGKPSGHVATTASCDSCHRMGGNWLLVSGGYNHSGVLPGTCATCHGRTATGLPVTHKGGSNPAIACDSCHRTTAWRPATMNHTVVSTTPCSTCHNNSLARGVPAGHKGGMTPGACNGCHNTTAWIPAIFNHTGVTPGTCTTCHGRTATGLPVTHKGGSNPAIACDSCHRTTGWRPATMNHTVVAATPCANCHNGNLATGKSAAHFVTTQACNACHTTTAWTPVTTYTHKSPYYKAHRAGTLCSACHTTNNEVIAWRFAAYKPDCAGCHAGDFKPGPHKKVDSPLILYTVAELKDCSGSCHIYTDATFTKIKTSRTGQHRPTGSF